MIAVITQVFKQRFFKSAVGFFSFFSSTNVEKNNVCFIAYNVRDAISEKIKREYHYLIPKPTKTF